MPEESTGKIIRAEGVFQRRSAISGNGLVYDVPAKASARPLINGLSFDIANEGITTIMGPNGAGKSLLLRMMATLILPNEGELRWFGGKRAAKGDVAIVFQRPVLLRRTVRQNLEHALAIYRIPKEERAGRCAELLKLGRLEEIPDRPARVLSGGEQQRLSLIRALAAKPKLLLLDEPTASLDPQSTSMIEELIRKAQADGIKCILVTHDRGQAARISDDIIFMHSGNVVEHTPSNLFFNTPKTVEAQAYLDGRLLVD